MSELCEGIRGPKSALPGHPCGNKINPGAREDGHELCYQHWQPKLAMDDPRRTLKPGPGRPRTLRPAEVLQKMVDDKVEDIVRVFFDAIEATDVSVVKNGDEIEIIEKPNHSIRMRAADALLDRAYGKAVQRSENMNVNVGIEARTEGELEALADAMRAARSLEPADPEEDYIEGTASEE